MSLTKLAEECLEHYSQEVAKSAGVANPSKKFSIQSPMETKLRQAIMLGVGFMSLITVSPVEQIKGQVVDVGTGSLLTGRVKGGRFRGQVGMDGNTYELVKTDSGAAIPWELIVQWANSGDKGQFIKLMNNAMTQNFGLDILKIGFNGTSIAETTDPINNPLGQDVNKGWLAIAKEKAAAQVLASAKLDPTGAVEESYKNLDSLANDLKNNVIHEAHQEDPDLVVVVGRNLVTAEQHRLLEAADTPTEHKAAQSLSKTIAGMKAYTAPYFPANGLWVTSLKNLQVLQQKGTQHRKSRDEEDRAQYETTWWRFEGYAIGNLNKFAAIESVEIVEPVAPAA